MAYCCFRLVKKVSAHEAEQIKKQLCCVMLFFMTNYFVCLFIRIFITETMLLASYMLQHSFSQCLISCKHQLLLNFGLKID